MGCIGPDEGHLSQKILILRFGWESIDRRWNRGMISRQSYGLCVRRCCANGIVIGLVDGLFVVIIKRGDGVHINNKTISGERIWQLFGQNIDVTGLLQYQHPSRFCHKTQVLVFGYLSDAIRQHTDVLMRLRALVNYMLSFAAVITLAIVSHADSYNAARFQVVPVL